MSRPKKKVKEQKVLHMAPDGFTVLDQHGNVDGFFGIVKKRKPRIGART